MTSSNYLCGSQWWTSKPGLLAGTLYSLECFWKWKTSCWRNSFKRKRPDIPRSSPESLQFLLSPCHELMFVFHSWTLRNIKSRARTEVPWLACSSSSTWALTTQGPQLGQIPCSSHSHYKQTKKYNRVILCLLAATCNGPHNSVLQNKDSKSGRNQCINYGGKLWKEISISLRLPFPSNPGISPIKHVTFSKAK